MLFRDRKDAGRRLAERLSAYAEQPKLLVLALPRGGVPVALEIALALHAPLDVFLVRKLGVPGHQELAMGALASGGVRVINEEVTKTLDISDDVLDAVSAAEQKELERRERSYRGDQGAVDACGHCVILVDDGLATGSTMRAAVKALRKQCPERIVVAVPVGAVETCSQVRDDADEVVCLNTPDPFFSVGMWYDDFSQTTDDEVRRLLERAAAKEPTETNSHF
jgi:putative phosphoribosyl transferase